MRAPWHVSKGFSLIQVSMLLAAGALVLAANLPGRDAGDYNQKVLDTLYKLDKVEVAMQGFMAAHGRRPCPADGQYDVNAQAFGLEAGALVPNAPLTECSGGSPAAPMGPDAGTGNVYMGTIPTKSLSLPDDYAYDAWGRRFTYVVDKRATDNAACYGMSTASTPGGVVVQHKAPRDIASFLQRKGRAGRTRHMRPWTLEPITLSYADQNFSTRFVLTSS
jgi:hypothetical protein